MFIEFEMLLKTNFFFYLKILNAENIINTRSTALHNIRLRIRFSKLLY